MPSISLTINDTPMLGSVGAIGTEVSATVGRLWIIYCRYFQEVVAEGREAQALRHLSTWKVNGKEIEYPDAYFIRLVIGYPDDAL